MKDKHFDTFKQEQQYYAKKKLRRNNCIALVIIISVTVLLLWIKIGSSKRKYIDLFNAVKSGVLFEPEFLAAVGVTAVIAAVICLIFRKKEKSSSKLISGAITAAVGTTMIGMMIIMCVKAV